MCVVQRESCVGVRAGFSGRVRGRRSGEGYSGNTGGGLVGVACCDDVAGFIAFMEGEMTVL